LNPLKKLASQTAIYGLPTIVGRLLNYLLTPLYTYNFTTGEYGLVTSAYAYVSFLLVFLTYGMETALFRFSQTENDKQKVFTTALLSILTSSSLFLLFIFLFANDVASLIKFNEHPEYVIWFAIIIASDAIAAVPFAKLREQGKAKNFALIKSLNILINLSLNIFFIVICKSVNTKPDSAFYFLVQKIYNPEIGIGYIFISNLIASLFTLLMLAPMLKGIPLKFGKTIWKNMMRYSLPLLIAGLAGMINETLDRILLTHLLPENVAMMQTGIYGACYKVSIIMSIFIQTFRFAAEPFFFSHSTEKDSKKTYALIMKYFVIVCTIIFLGTMLNIQWIQYFVGEDFREGMNVVPILLLANMCLGVFFNQSIWYKLTGQTHYGAMLTIIGAVITVALNFLWIPTMGYMGSAWATLICYASMMSVSYFWGNKYYPVNYDLKKIGGYVLLALLIYFVIGFIKSDQSLYIGNTLLLAYIAFVYWIEKKEIKNLSV
jgi:O-antigen/teichoic acid export membrane protein